MDNEIRFLYSVYPKKPIKNLLPNGRPINSAKSLQLTKEQVLLCMKSGTVYRRFGDGNTERVTTLNIDRLHNRELISEKDWKNSIKEEKAVEEVSKPEPDKEPEKVEGTVESKEPEKVEEPEAVEPVEEESTDEIAETVEDEVEVTDTVEATDEIAEVKEDEESDERGTVVNTEAELPEQITPANGYNGYYNKKKKRH